MNRRSFLGTLFAIAGGTILRVEGSGTEALSVAEKEVLAEALPSDTKALTIDKLAKFFEAIEEYDVTVERIFVDTRSLEQLKNSCAFTEKSRAGFSDLLGEREYEHPYKTIPRQVKEDGFAGYIWGAEVWEKSTTTVEGVGGLGEQVIRRKMRM